MGDSEALPVADGIGFGGKRRRRVKMRNLDDSSGGRVLSDGCGGGWIVDDDGARALGDAPEHREVEVAGIGGRGGAGAVQLTGETAVPFAVVVDELVDVIGLVELSQEEVVENGVVENDDARVLQRATVNGGMEAVVSEVVESGIEPHRVEFHAPVDAESGEEGRGVVGDAGWSGR
jgi:hypothetical protein